MLADKHKVPIEYIHLTAGADQAIMLLGIVFGQDTHIFTPTYISYGDVTSFGGKITEHYSLNDNNYTVSTETKTGASLIFLANPNNPAGITKKDDVINLVDNNPRAIVAVDEAYGDFTEESVAGDVLQHKNLVVIRSFSKAYSLAGFRIGYVIADPEIIRRITFESTWFNVAFTSVGAAIAALQHEEYFHKIRQDIISERSITETALSGSGYAVIPSHINAVLLKFDDEQQASQFVSKLKDAGIVVNHGNVGSNLGLNKTFVRISIGTIELMKTFHSIVAKF